SCWNARIIAFTARFGKGEVSHLRRLRKDRRLARADAFNVELARVNAVARHNKQRVEFRSAERHCENSASRRKREDADHASGLVKNLDSIDARHVEPSSV